MICGSTTLTMLKIIVLRHCCDGIGQLRHRIARRNHSPQTIYDRQHQGVSNLLRIDCEGEYH